MTWGQCHWCHFTSPVAKRMQLLRELVPAAKRLALLNNPTDAVNESLPRDVKAAAIGQQILVFEAATCREIDAAFESLVREKVDALFVAGGAFLSARRVQLAVLAARYAVPAAYSQRAFVAAGGLMSYGTNFSDTFRQVGLYAAPERCAGGCPRPRIANPNLQRKHQPRDRRGAYQPCA